MPATWTTPKNWNAGELLIASDLNTQLRDNMEWLKSPPRGTTLVATTTTTSASFVAVTGGSVSVTSVGGNVRVFFVGYIANTGAGNTVNLDIAIDGTRQGDTTLGLGVATIPGANYGMIVSVEWLTTTPPSSASHTYALYWKTSAGTATIYGRIWAEEV